MVLKVCRSDFGIADIGDLNDQWSRMTYCMIGVKDFQIST
jgi:hypothetical protein